MTYIEHMVAGLSAQGTFGHVLSLSEMEAGSDLIRATDILTPSMQAEGPVSRLIGRYRWHTDQITAMARRNGVAIGRALRANPPDIVEVEETYGYANWINSPTVPIVVRLHGPWFINGPASDLQNEPDFDRRCDNELRALTRAAGITAPSRAVLDRTLAALKTPPRHFEVIPNPSPQVGPAFQWNILQSRPNSVLYVGRFDRLKGADVMLRAFVDVCRKIPDATLVFVGPGAGFKDDSGKVWDLDEYLSSHVPPEVRARITVLGRQTPGQIQIFRREARLAVVASRQENFPFSVAEAQCAGLPVVAANVGGIPELIQDGVDGLLFNREDHVHLARRIIEVLTNDSLALSLGLAGLIRSRQLSPQAIAGQSLSFYERCIESMKESG